MLIRKNVEKVLDMLIGRAGDEGRTRVRKNLHM